MEEIQINDYDYLFKILLIGDSGVGKSSLLTRFVDNSFNYAYLSTIGVDFAIKTLTCNNKKCKFQIWDTAGQERFRSITTSYYRGAKGMIVVYDITNKESFNSISKWISDINNLCNREINIIIVGNKIDCQNDRQVTNTNINDFINNTKYIHMEVSAKTGTGVNLIFKKLAEELIKNDIMENKQKILKCEGIVINENTKSCCFKK